MGLKQIICLSLLVACAAATGYNSCPTLFNFYPDSADCTRFYRCVWGRPVQFRCPVGTRWSQPLLTCDYAYNVPCGAYPTIVPYGHGAQHTYGDHHPATVNHQTYGDHQTYHPATVNHQTYGDHQTYGNHHPATVNHHQQPDYYNYVNNYGQHNVPAHNGYSNNYNNNYNHNLNGYTGYNKHNAHTSTFAGQTTDYNDYNTYITNNNHAAAGHGNYNNYDGQYNGHKK